MTGMGLDIRDITIVVQHRIATTTTAADVWQRIGRCARDPSIDGLGVVLIDNIDRYILDLTSPVVKGFDYSLALTPTTIGQVRAAIAVIYDEAHRVKGGSEIDPGLLWLINTRGCRMRLLYALFSDPSAFDFSCVSEFKCACDNCSFPTRTVSNRLLPPEELMVYIQRAPGAAILQQQNEIDFAHLRQDRTDSVVIDTEIGKQSVLNFTLNKTLRFRDSAAYENVQVQEEMEKMLLAKSRNPSALQKIMIERIKQGWANIAHENGLVSRTGLLAPFLFPEDIIKRIAASPDTVTFAEEGDIHTLERVIGPNTRLNGLFIRDYIPDIRQFIATAIAEHRSMVESQTEAARALGLAMNSSRQTSRQGSTEPALDLFCPVCYTHKAGGHTARNETAFRRHINCASHARIVRRVLQNGTSNPRYATLVESLRSWRRRNLIDDPGQFADIYAQVGAETQQTQQAREEELMDKARKNVLERNLKVGERKRKRELERQQKDKERERELAGLAQHMGEADGGRVGRGARGSRQSSIASRA